MTRQRHGKYTEYSYTGQDLFAACKSYSVLHSVMPHEVMREGEPPGEPFSSLAQQELRGWKLPSPMYTKLGILDQIIYPFDIDAKGHGEADIRPVLIRRY
jgi:hypothetical protein